MKTVIWLLIAGLLTSPVAHAQAPAPSAETDTWRRVANAMTLGSKVKVETIERRRYSGTLMQVTDSEMVIKRSTRMPEPPLTVPFDQVSRIEKDQGGLSAAKAIGVGIAAGAGAMLSLILMAFAFAD